MIRQLDLEICEVRRMLAGDTMIPGDANLDGGFDSSDLVAVFQTGEYEDGIAGNSVWADGDWNGDGEFDSSDIVTAFQAGRYTAEPTLFPDVIAATLARTGNNTYRVSVTLSSPYDTPQRYADAWRVLGSDCEELGVRILHARPPIRTTVHAIAVWRRDSIGNRRGYDSGSRSDFWLGRRHDYARCARLVRQLLGSKLDRSLGRQTPPSKKRWLLRVFNEPL